MAVTTGAPDAATAAERAAAQEAADRRSFWLAGATITAVLLLLVGIFVAFYPEAETKGLTKEEQLEDARTRSPGIIPKPSEGRTPENPGDPGGWEQLALFGVVTAGLATMAVLAWRSSLRARRRPA